MKEKTKIDIISAMGTIIALVIFSFALSWMFISSLKKEEKRECIQWQNWMREIRVDVFAPSVEMTEQCRRVGVELPAKIKKEVFI